MAFDASLPSNFDVAISFVGSEREPAGRLVVSRVFHAFDRAERRSALAQAVTAPFIC